MVLKTRGTNEQDKMFPLWQEKSQDYHRQPTLLYNFLIVSSIMFPVAVELGYERITSFLQKGTNSG